MKVRTVGPIAGGVVVAAGIILLYTAGCEQGWVRWVSQSPLMTRASADAHTKVVMDNAQRIAEDIAFILEAMDKTSKRHDFREGDIDQDVLAKDITEAISKGSLQYRECKYVSFGDCSGGNEEYRGWTSGLIERYDPGTHPDLGAYWLSYRPPVVNQVRGASRLVSFEIMVKDDRLMLFYFANPSPVYDPPNFECLPRTKRL